MSSGGWIIEHPCPQCGAPVTLEETDHIISCDFCRVRHFLTASDGYRFFLSPRGPTDEDLVFVPYLRFRGMVFSCRQLEVHQQVVDTSLVAARCSFLPQSLGVRPQAMTLRFVSPDIRARFVKTQIQFDDIFSRVGTHLNISAPAGRAAVSHRAFVGEAVSRIYTPIVFENGMLYDAIVKKPLKRVEADRLQGMFEFDRNESWKVSFLPTLCPHCGWDMQGDRQSCVLLCTNCHSAWEASSKGFRQVPHHVVPADGRAVVHIPFWRMKAAMNVSALQTYADLIRFGNLPKVIQPDWEQRELYFWSPAFKIQPRLFLRLCHQVTLLQPGGGLAQGLEGMHPFPVTLPSQEAAESIPVTLASLAVDRKRIYPLLPDLLSEVQEHALIYLPFAASGTDLVQCQLKFSINRNAMMLGRKI